MVGCGWHENGDLPSCENDFVMLEDWGSLIFFSEFQLKVAATVSIFFGDSGDEPNVSDNLAEELDKNFW